MKAAAPARKTSSPRVRLDQALVSGGQAPTRERARAAIMAGKVFVDGARVDKPGALIRAGAALEMRGAPHPYVGRGGVKLQKALAVFGLDVRGAVALDVGASTGGFTDCLLQDGAARVYAVDVGYGQLDLRLRGDPRVVVLERVNARDLSRAFVPEPIDVCTADVSFISVAKALRAAVPLLRDGADVVVLVKPQFEAGRGVAKRGVVRDPAVHAATVREAAAALAALSLGAIDVTPSPIRGDAGNVEFLMWLIKGAEPRLTGDRIERAVRDAREPDVSPQREGVR
jgi:23S rRNA (cytidine1920-2'-O)/16S rRNA (cytidine1409-2'-O)-methyltransferase